LNAQYNGVYYVKVCGKNIHTSQRNYSLLVNTISIQPSLLSAQTTAGGSSMSTRGVNLAKPITRASTRLFNGDQYIGAGERASVEALDVTRA
jgi:hypothetical protein